ncbi:hypothetical protein ACFWOT_21790 [Streptomyces sp. NPDC058440]|uniref:hypothetical protein n=1 Tax=Streptomyces sp. NPDC058440 TaxID=3346501 RepID=UPI00364E1C31
MSDPIPPLLPCVALLLASVAILLSLARTVVLAPDGSVMGQHRRPGPPLTYQSQARPRPRFRRTEAPLVGETTRSVRPYVVAAEQAARRRELELAALGLDGPGPYVIHGVEVA